ncbi:hypothetical protein [Streptomyces sp. P9-A2]
MSPEPASARIQNLTLSSWTDQNRFRLGGMEDDGPYFLNFAY